LAERFDLSCEEVAAIEGEGVSKVWPPLCIELQVSAARPLGAKQSFVGPWVAPCGATSVDPSGRTRDAADQRPDRGLDRFGQRRPPLKDQREVRVGWRFAGQGLGKVAGTG